MEESPYLQLEELFLKQSVDYANSQFSRFSHNLKMFERFLESESALISLIFLNRSYCEYYVRVSQAFMRKIEAEVVRIAVLRNHAKPIELSMNEAGPEDTRRVRTLSEIVCYSRSPEGRKIPKSPGFDDLFIHRADSISADECLEEAGALYAAFGYLLAKPMDLYAVTVGSTDSRR